MAWTSTNEMRATELLAATPESQVSTNSAVSLGNNRRATTSVLSSPRVNRSGWVYACWFMGFAISLVPACFGFASLYSLARRSRRLTGGRLYQALSQTADRCGVRRLPRLLESDARTMPMTWGIWQSSILLPREANDWSEDRLRVVLLHELAHVQRRDCLVQMLAQVARAIYWFNPLVWLAERRIRVEQELACDDRVLGQGFRPSDYAQHLLEVLASLPSPRFTTAVGLAMARRTKLERRLKAILGSSGNRHALSPRRLAAALGTALLLLVAMSALHVQTVKAGGEPQDKKAAPDQTTTAADRSKLWAELRTKIADQYVGVVDEAGIEQGAIQGMLKALGDPHSDFLTADALAEIERQIAGSLVGIGVHLEQHEKQFRVVTPLPGSPGLQAGIQPGDVLVQIDGQAIDKLKLGDVVNRIRGTEGTVVRLKINRGDAEKDFEVKRGPIKLETVRGFHRTADNQWNYQLSKNPKVGYMQFTQFGSQTPQELRSALESLKGQKVDGLILDLRFCPGGLLDSAVDAAKQFVSSGTIVSLHGRTGDPITIKADAEATFADAPIVVLVNQHTASAAEVFAGAMQDNQRAIVVGTRTHGKGSVQTLIKLAGASGAIRLTTSSYHLPSGRNIDRRPDQTTWGINPNDGYFVPLDVAQTKTMTERRVARDVLGAKSQAHNAESPITPAWLEQQAADPQLAAALKTLTDRVKTGAFTKVNQMSSTDIDKFIKRQEIEQQRDAVLKTLEKFDRELAELGK
jgi:carboxyl-terminal processing protease